MPRQPTPRARGAPKGRPGCRATIYFDHDLHRALRLKAAETDQSVSEVVNQAVRSTLSEDVDDLAAFRQRANEPTLPFEQVLRDLKRRGKL
ncbi:MAG TPA: CopG family transcriptional regulator [Polyangia bacterium]|nr:CopG family transcriptional regulator [Polyangia bacterium]